MGKKPYSRFWDNPGSAILEIVKELFLGIVKDLWLLFFLAGAILLAILASKLDPPLGKAAADGDLAEVQRLVEGGASINRANPLNGDTPLDMALIYANASDHTGDNFGVAKYLLDKGAKVSAGTLELAILNGRLDLVKEIMRRGENPRADSLALYVSSVVESSSLNFDQELADFLLSSGADINEQHEDAYKDKSTALGFAVHYRDIGIVRYLVERGADVNKPMFNGKTPLELAEEEYKVYEGDPTGPGIHYYRVVPPASEIAFFLRQHGAR